jgi:hypothetical protein
MLAVATTAQKTNEKDNSQRRTYKECVLKQLRYDNEYAAPPNQKLGMKQLAKLDVLINHEIDMLSLENVNDRMQPENIEHIKVVAMTDMPNISTNVLNEVLYRLKGTAGHCEQELNNKPSSS